jgi:hypothetical protein
MKNMEITKDTGALHTKAQTERTLKKRILHNVSILNEKKHVNRGMAFCEHTREFILWSPGLQCDVVWQLSTTTALKCW